MGNGPFINDLPVKDADFQEQTVTLAQGNSYSSHSQSLLMDIKHEISP